MPFKIIINSINTTSAGTANVTKNLLISFLCDSGRTSNIARRLEIIVPPEAAIKKKSDSVVKVRALRLPKGLSRLPVRFLFDVLALPVFQMVIRPNYVVHMGNYAFFPSIGEKIVLMRHPYLVDDAALQQLSGMGPKIFERLRRLAFVITLMTTDVLIVQTPYIADRVRATYKLRATRLKILPNPIAPEFFSEAEKGLTSSDQGATNVLFYPSRYYPHKNHGKLLDLAITYSKDLESWNVKIIVTVREHDMPEELAKKLSEARRIGIVENIGEIKQAELISWYKCCSCVIFPSISETFGNPLLEARVLRCKILVSDRPYSRSLLGATVTYFNDQSVESMRDAIYHGLFEVGDNLSADAAGDTPMQALDGVEWLERAISDEV